MKIGLDVSPLENASMLAHRVRGTGFYIENLKKSLLKYFPDNKYIFFTRGEKIPEDVDIVHYPYFEPFFLTLPFRRTGKTIVTVHDLTPLVFPKEFPYGFRGFLKWLIQKASLKRVDAIISDSECSRRDTIRLLRVAAEKVFTVRLAASEEFVIVGDKTKFLQMRKKYNLPEKFALYVGDVTWNKNLPRLLKAVNQVKIPLIMVGKTLVSTIYDRNNYWNKDLVKVQEMAGESALIIRLGYVPTDDLVLLYNMATVFIMPSLYEGFGLPILEAMQCGCPLLTSKEGSIPEVVEDAGLYVDAYSVSDIAAGLKEAFLNTSLQRKLSEKGLRQAKKFSWEITVKKTFEVYNQVYEKNH